MGAGVAEPGGAGGSDAEPGGGAAGAGVRVPYAAYLRVYEPLAAFPEAERDHWYRYAAAGPRRTAQDELREALADLVPTPPLAVPEHESGDAFVTEVDGVVHVCPWRTRLRRWLALEELPGRLPAPVLDAVLPPVVRGQAAADYERWRAEHPDARPWIRDASWHVPVRWFALFADEEREFEPSVKAADGSEQPLLRYRTPMVEARRRTARALRVLREAASAARRAERAAEAAAASGEAPGAGSAAEEGGGGVVRGDSALARGTEALAEGLVDVGRWLEEFHPRSLVELDYGGLVHAVPPGALAEDRSAADVAEGLAALREGDGERAGEAYDRLVERWRAVRELMFAS
jgi:hypothetical protein